MKFPRFYDILDETVIELKTDFETTVERLQALQGVCRNTDADQGELSFLCTPKGRLRVDSIGRRRRISRLNFVVGEVVEENGKTVVKIYCVHDRSEKKVRNVIWTVYALVFAAFVLFGVSALKQGAHMTPKDIGTAVAFFALLAIIPFRTARETENQHADLETMKTELLNRIQAVERWDN